MLDGSIREESMGREPGLEDVKPGFCSLSFCQRVNSGPGQFIFLNKQVDESSKQHLQPSCECVCVLMLGNVCACVCVHICARVRMCAFL